jgi:hypothetical protein
MPSINSVRVSLTQIKNLQNLFVLLESFQVSRFSLSRTADGPKDASLDERIKAFASQMSTFELGELRTWGWPVDPKYLNCWSWNANVLAVVRENFPEWLNATGDPQITWSFFHRLRLKLNLDGTQVATFTDLLPAEIAELQSLGLECEIETKWKAALPDPRPEVLRIAEVDKPEIKKDIDRVVTFDGVGEAHRALEAGETLGRVVLKIEQECGENYVIKEITWKSSGHHWR